MSTGALRTTVISVAGSMALIGLILATEDAAAQTPNRTWIIRDVGSVASPGNAVFNASTGELTVNATGLDVGGITDSFAFVYRTLTGDAEMVACVKSLDHTSDNALGGIMIRQTFAANSPSVAMLVMASGKAKFRSRKTAGGVTISVGPSSGHAPPQWVKLVRRGNSFSGYVSTDGTSWSYVGSELVLMPANSAVYVGIAVASFINTASNPTTAVIDGISIGLPGGWQTADVGTILPGSWGNYSLANFAPGNTTERHRSPIFNIVSSGTNIVSTADGFHIIYQKIAGDSEIAARVTANSNTSPFATAGITIRQNLTAGSAHATMLVRADGGTRFRARLTPAATITNIIASSVTLPCWLKVKRVGSTFTGYSSLDGVTWSSVGSVSIAMSGTIYVGMIGASYTNTAVDHTASFDNVAIPQLHGRWQAKVKWPYVAIHAALLPNGKVIFWTRDDINDPTHRTVDGTGGGMHTQLWDPKTKIFAPAPIPTDIFCAGHSFLADGRLFVPGGHFKDSVGLHDTSIFDYRNNTWMPGPTMNELRWYPTATTLSDGSVLVISGTISAGVANTIPQVWSPGTNTYRPMPAPPSGMVETKYPWMHLAPNGKVFVSGPRVTTGYLDTKSAGAWSTGPRSSFGVRSSYGSSILYGTGKVIIVGGGAPPTNTAEVVDLTSAAPTWRYVPPMSRARQHMNATLLADGNIVVFGGTSMAENNAAGANHCAELWNPVSEQWSELSCQDVDRMYHSISLLLPDATVLSAGGGAGKGGALQYDMEIFVPPYLQRGSRPTISSVSGTSVVYGSFLQVNTPDAANISKVTWLRLGAVTHGFDENQRINNLTFTKGSGYLTVTLPINRNLSPPGHYMLFVLNGRGVPSEARIIKIGP